jgi:hypothetical protein
MDRERAQTNMSLPNMSVPSDQRLSLGPDQLSDVAMALLTLSHEVWTLNDRVRMLEAVLGDQGVDIHDAVNRYQPDQILAAEQAAKANAFVARILGALAGQAPQNPPELG